MFKPFVYRNALRDFLRPTAWMTWGSVALLVFLIGRVRAIATPGMDVHEAYGQISSLVVFKVLALSAAIFSTSVVSQEVEQKTIVYLLTRSIPRPTLLLSRSLAAMTAITAVTLLSWLAAVLGTLGADGLISPGPRMDLLLILAGAAAYGSFFVALSLVVNRAMIWSLLFAFGWETFVPNMPGALYYLSIDSYLRALSANPRPGDGKGLLGILSGKFGEQNVPALTSWLVLLGLGVGLLALAMYWFSHFEFVPREDGE